MDVQFVVALLKRRPGAVPSLISGCFACVCGGFLRYGGVTCPRACVFEAGEHGMGSALLVL